MEWDKETRFIGPAFKVIPERTRPDSDDIITYRSVIVFSDEDGEGENEAHRIANMVRKFSVPVKVKKTNYVALSGTSLEIRVDRVVLFLVLSLPVAGDEYHDKVIRVLHFLSGYLGQEYAWMDRVEKARHSPAWLD